MTSKGVGVPVARAHIQTCDLLIDASNLMQIGHIKDIGHDPSLPTTRLYATHEAQPYHNDSSDIVGAPLLPHSSVRTVTQCSACLHCFLACASVVRAVR